MLTRQIYYIGTGALSAMYTLRCARRCEDSRFSQFMPDHYVCNLTAAGEENDARAIEKAVEYVDAMRDRIGETEEFKIEFAGIWEDAMNVRRGRLSARETNEIETIERGFFPFGKNNGKPIADAEPGYVLYWADMFGQDNRPVVNCLAAACMGVALENGYIAKRDIARAERRTADEASEFVGTVGERREFSGEIVSTVFKRYFDCDQGQGYFITKIRADGNLLTYIGSSAMGERGEVITFKATIKSHETYNGIKSTRINRPKVTA